MNYEQKQRTKEWIGILLSPLTLLVAIIFLPIFFIAVSIVELFNKLAKFISGEEQPHYKSERIEENTRIHNNG